MYNCPYPWQIKYWQQLLSIAQKAKIPHALLVTGMRGLGKLAFVSAVANTLLCHDGLQLGYGCGRCRSCLLSEAQAHPDCKIVTAAEQNTAIKIDQIRELVDWISKTTQHGGFKIAIIAAAERLNIAAANALLKTLEEPTPNTLLFLVTHQPALLSATIRSRCQRISIQNPDLPATANWLSQQLPHATDIDALLRLAEGAPLTALALADGIRLKQQSEFINALSLMCQKRQEPISLASQWVNYDFSDLLNWLIYGVEDLIKLCLGLAEDVIKLKESKGILVSIAGRAKVSALYKYYDKLFLIKRFLQRNQNMNQQLLLEELFYEWSEMF